MTRDDRKNEYSASRVEVDTEYPTVQGVIGQCYRQKRIQDPSETQIHQ